MKQDEGSSSGLLKQSFAQYHATLHAAVFSHSGFMKEALSVLRSVCFHCSALRVSRDDLKFKMAQRLKNGQMRLQAMHEICRNKKRCAFGDAEEMQRSVDELDLGLARRGDADEETSRGGCGGMQPTFVKKGLKIEVEFPASGNQPASLKLIGAP